MCRGNISAWKYLVLLKCLIHCPSAGIPEKKRNTVLKFLYSICLGVWQLCSLKMIDSTCSLWRSKAWYLCSRLVINLLFVEVFTSWGMQAPPCSRISTLLRVLPPNSSALLSTTSTTFLITDCGPCSVSFHHCPGQLGRLWRHKFKPCIVFSMAKTKKGDWSVKQGYTPGVDEVWA